MKTSKSGFQTAAQEECGVWLDTVQLKGKAKQKRSARPISKMLNPFAEGGGYSLAVALNFTQTKMEMPKTKQSSISTFFTPQRRVVNRMSSSEVTNLDPATSPLLTSVASMQKRGHRLEKSDLFGTERGLDCDRDTESGPDSEGDSWQKREKDISPTVETYFRFKEDKAEEGEPPQRRRRLTEADSQPPPPAWSQDPLLTYSQDPESEFFLTDHKPTNAMSFSSSGSSFLVSSQCEGGFGNWNDSYRRTSTQKPVETPPSPITKNNKENTRPLSLNSPNKHSAFSHLGYLSESKWTYSKPPSPLKHTDQLRSKAGRDGDSKGTKLSSSPLKKLKQQSRQVEEDSLAMLFTQDSEGFRVIAHRGLLPRSPFKDQSNQSVGIMRASAHKSVSDEEEDEVLFTQDSQGNTVIKH
ncbi:uncharacterized protein aunip [Menidia menidia]